MELATIVADGIPIIRITALRSKKRRLSFINCGVKAHIIYIFLFYNRPKMNTRPIPAGAI